MERSLGAWESYLRKVEAEFDGIDGVFGIEELELVWDEFTNGRTVSSAVERVAEYAAQMVVRYFSTDPNDREDYDDSMDGDHDSALASAGWGTDEDYGCFGGEDY